MFGPYALLARPFERSLASSRPSGERRSRIEPHRQAGPGHIVLGLAHGIFAEVEDRRRQHGAGMAVADAFDQVVEIADAARGDHRHGDRVGDGAGQRDVKALSGAVAIYRGEQYLAGAERDHLAGISAGVDAGRIAAAVGENLPAVRLARPRHFLGVDGDHDALIAEFLRRFLDEGAARDRSRIDRHLVGAGGQQRADVVDAAYAAADRKRHEAGFGRAPYYVEHDTAVLVARRDVEEGELVGAGFVVSDRGRDRIAGIAQIDEIDALDDAAVLDVEAGDERA